MGNIECPTLSTKDVNTGDTAWILISAALVLLMTPGLGFFYGGLVKHKNVINTLMMSYAAMGVVACQWVLFGYSFAFGPGSSIWGSFKWGGLNNVGNKPYYTYGTTIPLVAHMNYQMMFAIITPALISGGIVERVKFSSYLIFIVLWTTIVYDPLAHWMWSGWVEHNSDGTCRLEYGWLRKMGALDFAGGTVIHISSGFSALVAAGVVGKRQGYNPKVQQQAGNVPYVLLGMALLWFGWIGFNGGSAGSANHIAATAGTNTTISAASGFTTWMICDMIGIRRSNKKKRQPSATGAACGAVVGLVAITPASGYVSASYAILFGIISVVATLLAMRAKSYLSNLDDSLDVFYCHGVGGMVGSFLTGLFASLDVNEGGANGAFFGNPKLLGYQCLAIVVTIGVSVMVTGLILFFLKASLGLALDRDEEALGLDAFIHGEHIDIVTSGKVTPQVESPHTVVPNSNAPVHYRAWDNPDS